MNRKTLGIIVLVILIIVGYNSDFMHRATIRRVIEEPATSSSMLSFDGKAGEKVFFKIDSTVESGILQLVLDVPDGATIKTFELNTKTKWKLELPFDGTYKLHADYEAFTGNFTMRIR